MDNQPEADSLKGKICRLSGKVYARNQAPQAVLEHRLGQLAMQ